MNTYISKSPEETINLALQIAANLKGGEILALKGDLGAGKTTFTKGLAEGLKVLETITSPTFVILKTYSGIAKDNDIELVHVDAYRTDTIEDIKSVGIEDYLGRDDVVMVVEWPEKIAEILPQETIWVNFKNIAEDKREIEYDFKN